MPHLDKYYKYEPLPFYPHMGPKDTYIWNTYVHHNPRKFETVVYDMRCGEIAPVDPTLPGNIQDAWRDLCRWRIDVVAENKTGFFVIEVKPRALAPAIGQAISNAILFKAEHHPSKPVIPTVITDVIIPATQAVADQLGVLLLTP